MRPLCGELNTTGPRHCAGSKISNGGSSSLSRRLIASQAPLLSSAKQIVVIGYISMRAPVCQDRSWKDRSWDQPQFRVHPKFTPIGLMGLLSSVHRTSRSSMTKTMPKILLAEDDNDMRRFLVKALENAGYEVTDYDNGMSAYRRLREEPFELLLTDIVMPEMDGIELARRASELDPDIKIMFITGFAAVALNADSNAPKNAKVLSKPVHLRELVNEVQKMLAAAAQREALGGVFRLAGAMARR